jgi:thiol-disulfide isomerase/thioredoxin
MRRVALIALFAAIMLASFSYWWRSQNPSWAGVSAAPASSSGLETKSPSKSVNLLKGPLAPAIESNTWLNSPPLSGTDLHGKVVLVDFWTFDCINCRNTLPSLIDWYDKYHDRGLVIVGVHSPEFSYEHDVANVRQAIQDLHIPYSVALDNNMTNWNAFRVYAWPTWFILDKQGAIRFSHVGEGAYAESEQTIENLLGE